DVLREPTRLAEDTLAECRPAFEEQRTRDGVWRRSPYEAGLIEQPQDVVQHDLLIGDVHPDLLPSRVLPDHRDWYQSASNLIPDHQGIDVEDDLPAWKALAVRTV